MLQLFVLLLVLISFSKAHMSIWTPAMFAFNGPKGCGLSQDCGNSPVAPLGPGLNGFDEWWFRGVNYTDPSVLPKPGDAEILHAGGQLTMEIACHKAFTSFGDATTPRGSHWDACPDNPGPFHADYDTKDVLPELVSGCALGITDTTNWKDVTMDNIVIFSIQPNCVTEKYTSFDIPQNMPQCSGDHCICSWYWLTESGSANDYMTGFYCRVVGGSVEHVFDTPRPPVYCGKKAPGSKCVTGAKTPVFAYNHPNNLDVTVDLENRPGYMKTDWSFGVPGAQNYAIVRSRKQLVLGVNPGVMAAIIIGAIAGVIITIIIIVVLSWIKRRKRRHSKSHSYEEESSTRRESKTLLSSKRKLPPPLD